jgi:hypothetical protein
MENNNFLEELKKYFKETSREQVLLDWEKSKESDNVGVTVSEFLSFQRPFVSYDEFENKFITEELPFKQEFIRNGQCLMISLSKVSMDLYKKITSTENDCFYVDGKIPNTLKWLKENWMRQYPTIEKATEELLNHLVQKFVCVNYFEFENQDGIIYINEYAKLSDYCEYVNEKVSNLEEIYGYGNFLFDMDGRLKLSNNKIIIKK